MESNHPGIKAKFTLAVRDLVASEDEPAIITARAHHGPQVHHLPRQSHDRA